MKISSKSISVIFVSILVNILNDSIPAFAQSMLSSEVVRSIESSCDTSLQASPQISSHCGCIAEYLQTNYTIEEAIASLYSLKDLTIAYLGHVDIDTILMPPPIKNGILSCIPESLLKTSTSQYNTSLPYSEVERIAKKTTVRIDGPKSGSGVIIAGENNSYSVLTNYHVLDQSGQYTITTFDGQVHLINEITRLQDADLVIVNFVSNIIYLVAGREDLLNEGQVLYISGYPGALQRAQERTFRFFTENLTGFLAPSDIRDGYEFIFTGESLPGLSGSPIFNEKAQVVGIYGEAEAVGVLTGVRPLYGIPITTAERLAALEGYNWDSNHPLVHLEQLTEAHVTIQLIEPSIIDITYQENEQYEYVEIQRLINSAFWPEFNGKLVTFLVEVNGTYGSIGRIPSYYNLPVENRLFLDIRDADGSVLSSPLLRISIPVQHADAFLRSNNKKIALIYGVARVYSHEYIPSIAVLHVETHRLQIFNEFLFQ
jgi:hypothetical protein